MLSRFNPGFETEHPTGTASPSILLDNTTIRSKLISLELTNTSMQSVPSMATLRNTSQVYSCLHQRVNAIFDHYIAYANSSLAVNFAAEIHMVCRSFAFFLSKDSEGKGLNRELFDQVVARVMYQKAAASLPVSYQQNLLAKLCLHIFASSGNPTGTLKVQTLILEIGSRMVNLGTQLLDFIQGSDTDSADISLILARFTNLGCYMSAIATDGARQPAYPLDKHDLWSLGRVGVDIVLGIVKADNDFDIMDFMRLKLFTVAITWLDENKEFLSEELCEENDLYLCQYRLFSFYDSDWLELTSRGQYPILAHNANIAALEILRNIEKRFGHKTLLEIVGEYPDEWAEWIMRSSD